MAFTGNTAARYTGTQANDETLSFVDEITNLWPDETPFLASLTRAQKIGDPRNHQWQLDYTGRTASVGALPNKQEGADANPGATRTRPVLFNRTSILGYDWSVTGSQEATALRGIASEQAYQTTEYSKKLVSDMELACVQSSLDVDSEQPNSGSAGNWRKMGGLNHFIANYSSYYVTGTLATSNEQPYSADIVSDGAFDSTDIVTAHRTIASRSGARNLYAIAPGAVRDLIDTMFAPNSSTTSIYRRDMGAGTETAINLVVDAVKTAYGTIFFMWSLAAPTGTVLLYDPQYTQYAPFRDLFVKDLAVIGDDFKRMARVEGSMVYKAPNTVGRLINIS
jgi:hypothetical protein